MDTPRPAAYAVIDVEGNGHRPPDIVEIAIATIDDQTVGDVHSWLIRPPHPIDPIVTRKVHGIKNSDVADAPTWTDIRHEITRLLDGRIPVAHNARVEYDVLHRHLPDWEPVVMLDTLTLAKKIWPDRKGRGGYGLDALLAHAGIRPGDEHGQRHRAGYDAHATARLFLHLYRLLPEPERLIELAAIPGSKDTAPPPPTEQESLW